MTYYGLNPSFATWTSTLPLFSQVIRRGRRFEVFDELGRFTGEPSPLRPDGYPVEDGRLHGVRVFGDLTREEAEAWAAKLRVSPISNYPRTVVQGGVVSVTGRSWSHYAVAWVPRADCAGPWHKPSIQALRSLRPTVLRTLDWQMANKPQDWSLPRVKMEDPLQGTDRGMAVELQARAANALRSHLWWPAPPRYSLGVDAYEERLEEYLTVLRDECKLPPILEYGNELWNAGFPVHRWLRDWAPSLAWESATWHDMAALEIAMFKRVADRVFGEAGPLGSRPYYLFVGGQLTVPHHLRRILEALRDLGVTPDLAGPALYVTPVKEEKGAWESSGLIPTQEVLRDSMSVRLTQLYTPLLAHAQINADFGVPYFACYEAGQSLIAGSHPWRRAAIEAQRTEWMGDLYRGIRRAAEACGVDLLCWYSAATSQEPRDPRVDVFGLLEGDSSVPLLPKALAARGE